jgi:hypothetical protein
VKKPPEGLLASRPALEGENVPHPASGAPPGSPPRGYSRGLHDRIVELIRLRNRPAVAAAIAGIPSSTYYAWMRKGREGDPWLYEFACDVEKAMAEAESAAIQTITGPSPDLFTDPDSARWWLERARPEGYSKDTNTKVNALLIEFMERLERALPPEIFQMVVAAGQGQALLQEKPVFQLVDGDEEEDSESAGQDS